jgi:serine/threonine protein kinase
MLGGKPVVPASSLVYSSPEKDNSPVKVLRNALPDVPEAPEFRDSENHLSNAASATDRNEDHSSLSINFEDIELGELLGAGGNGRIFRASYNGTPVAVKELYSVMRGGSSEFSREFEALKLLRHPHIIQLFGTCVAPSVDARGMSRHFIVTELAHESLADRLSRLDDPIDMATAERYATEIASAGAFIHGQQMIQ